MAGQSLAGVGSGPRPKILAWVHHHREAAAMSVEKLLREPISNMFTVFVIAIALALPTFGLALASAVNQEVNRLDAPPQLSVLTDASLTLDDAKRLAEKIERQPGVASVKVIDRDTALTEFIEATGLDALSSRLNSNPFPIPCGFIQRQTSVPRACATESGFEGFTGHSGSHFRQPMARAARGVYRISTLHCLGAWRGNGVGRRVDPR